MSLRKVYDAERAYFKAHATYSGDLATLPLTPASWTRPAGFVLEATDDRFEARAAGHAAGSIWRIVEDGRIWVTRKP
jgi:hypothetical protein